MEFSFPWPETAGPVVGDGRKYTANEWSQLFEAVFGEMAGNEGVLPRVWNLLAVTAPAANTIRVATGMAFNHGHLYWNTANLDLAPGVAPGGQTRKDYCILRCDWVAGAQYTVRAVILTGTMADYPTPTQIDDNTWEYPLASYIIDDAGAITALSPLFEYCHFATMVSTAMLEALCVTTEKLALLSVDTGQLALLAVDTGQLAAGAVTQPKCDFNIEHGLVLPIGGELVVGDDQSFHLCANAAFTHTKIKLLVKVAPTGANLICEVECNGVPITTAGNRPTIVAGATAGNTVVFSVAAGAADEVYTLNVDQIGSTLPGEDLTCVVWGTQPPVA